MSSPSSVSDSSHSRPLFLSIDAGVSKYRATILDERLEVIWVEEVNLDSELPQYGCVVFFLHLAFNDELKVISPKHSTRNGVHTLGDRVTAPSEMRLKALDLLLEKLSRNTSQAQLIDQIVAISGAGQVSLSLILSYLTSRS
jgi:xylulokinase